MFRDDPAYGGQGGADLGAGEGRHRVHGRARPGAGGRDGADGGLPLRLLDAARPEDHDRRRSALLAAGGLRGAATCRKAISAAARPAPTICCSRRSRRNCATARSRNIATHGAEVIAAGNIGCMTQIGAGTGMPVVHTVELLDWATGGPMPAALRGNPDFAHGRRWRGGAAAE